MRFVLLITACLAVLSTAGCNLAQFAPRSVTAVVRDADTGKPVKDATVHIFSTGDVGQTDAKGRTIYQLNVGGATFVDFTIEYKTKALNWTSVVQAVDIALGQTEVQLSVPDAYVEGGE